MRSLLPAFVLSVICCQPFPAAAQKDNEFVNMAAQARSAWREGKTDEALKLATAAIAAEPKNPQAHALRGNMYEALRQPEKSVVDYSEWIKLAPESPEAYERRGTERLRLADAAGAVADFDRAIALNPKLEPGHWKRGIAYYYIGEFEKGRKQFEGYQTVDDSDVENVVWRMACMAKHEGFEKAQAAILKVGLDKRIPMKQVYELFAGRATPDDVLATAKAGDPSEEELLHQLFYAHLYLGLYYEARGDEANARKHFDAAYERKISHYMWDIAQAHRKLRKWDVK